jgi:DnaJ-class molecular chaperone
MGEKADRNYYEVLGVPRDASQDDIHQAWRKLAAINHPDSNSDPEKNSDCAEKMKEINKAYETLRVPAKRAEYDATLSSTPPSRQSKQPKGSGPGRSLRDQLIDYPGIPRSPEPSPADGAKQSSGKVPTARIKLTMSEVMRGTIKQIKVDGKLINLHISIEG